MHAPSLHTKDEPGASADAGKPCCTLPPPPRSAAAAAAAEVKRLAGSGSKGADAVPLADDGRSRPGDRRLTWRVGVVARVASCTGRRVAEPVPVPLGASLLLLRGGDTDCARAAERGVELERGVAPLRGVAAGRIYIFVVEADARRSGAASKADGKTSK